MNLSKAGPDVRKTWATLLEKIATPVLANLASGTLRQNMPVECRVAMREDRQNYTYLEATARLLAGLAPWLELGAGPDEESSTRVRLAELARRAIVSGLDPASPDRFNFSAGQQPIVDAAFLAHAMLRAPTALWADLPHDTRGQVIVAFISLRDRKPHFNNWLLFSAMTEALLAKVGAAWDPMRVDYALLQHEQWYLGNGMYGDGPHFHADYYNSYVIQPMLIDVLRTMTEVGRAGQWPGMLEECLQRGKRFAEIQERTIAPDGSFAPVGRSLAYRCGAFQHLAQMALQRNLSNTLTAAQVRGALDAVIRKTLDAPGTFDDNGWLTIGLCGHQPSIGEGYISTGSTYLCTTAFLPLGLRATHPFWTDAPTLFTQEKIWSGHDVPADHD